MKKLIGFIISILIICVVGFTCFITGKTIGKGQKDDASSIILKENEKENVNQSIAVVNLDEGTLSANEEKIYYGEKVIQFPDETFVYTSLEDARRGIENNNYSAYIIIPSTFSESVESLNDTPAQANLKYELNSKLTGEAQRDILYKVLGFGESLNSDLSYMYLENILQEFHQAQDYVNTIMNNDIKDKEAIEQVQAADLVEIVPIPELEREENTLKPIDASDYFTTNSNLVNQIDEEYKTNIEDSMEQLTNISNSGNTLSETLNSLSDNIGEIDLQTDENGIVIYEKGLQDLTDDLADFNTNMQTSKAETLSEIEKLEVQRKYIETSLNTSIEKYNQQLNNEVSEILSKYKSDLLVSVPTITYSEVNGSNGSKYELTCNTIEGQGAPPVVTISIVYDDLEEVEKRKSCLNAVLSRLLNAKEEKENKEVTLEAPVTDSGESESEETDGGETESEETNGGTTVTGIVEVDKSVTTALGECDTDSDLMQKMNECGYSNTSEFLSNVIAGNVVLEPSVHMEVTGSMDEINHYIRLGMEHIDTDTYHATLFTGNIFDENGEIILDDKKNPVTVSTLLNSYSEQLQGMNPKISLIAELNTQSVKDIVDKDCITPLLARTEKVKDIFEQRYTDEITEIETYQDLIGNYNPVQDSSQIDDYISQMKTNGAAMQDNMRDNQQEYIDFTEKAYMTTEENIIKLEAHINEAKETSENAVTNGLAAAKSAKAETSKENQQLMADFASKLPYTRLGSMEYKQAYEFIINPLNLSQVSNNQKQKDDIFGEQR